MSLYQTKSGMSLWSTFAGLEALDHLSLGPDSFSTRCMLQHGEATHFMILNPSVDFDGFTESLGCEACIKQFSSKPSNQIWQITFNPSGLVRTYSPEQQIIKKVIPI